MAVVDLTDREWDLLDSLKRNETIADVARRWATSRQNVANIRSSLIAKGVISPDPDNPADYLRVDQVYPWVYPGGVEVRYRPALPPTAYLRARYATETTRDQTVNPTRFVRWPARGVTVQGLPVCRPDNARPIRRSPEHRVVWVCIDDDPRSWAFAVLLDRDWSESGTVRELHDRRADPDKLVMDHKFLRGLTEMIAAAAGVGVGYDRTTPRTARPNP